MSLTGSIEKFDGKDYATYAVQLRGLLLANGLWEAIEPGSAQVPQEKVNKAMGIILTTLTRDVIRGNGFERMVSAKEMWAKLFELYGKRSQQQILQLQERLSTLRMKEGEDVNAYLKKVDEIVDDLVGAGEQVSESKVIAHILMGLPASWKHIAVALRGVQNLTKDYVVNELRNVSIGESSSGNGREVALAANGNRGQRKFFNGECHYCHRRGHREAECKKKRFDNARTRNREGSRGDGRAHVAQGPSENGFSFMASGSGLAGEWLIDSGASHHVCSLSGVCEDYTPCSDRTIRVGDGAAAQVDGVGSVRVEAGQSVLKLTNVLFVPTMMVNLVSLSALYADGYRVNFDEDGKGCDVVDLQGTRVARAPLRGGLFVIESAKAFVATAAAVSSLDLWHRRMGHVSCDVLKAMVAREAVVGVPPLSGAEADHVCEACVTAKQHAEPIRANSHLHRSTRVLEIVHSDVCGPITPVGHDGHQYFVTFTDDFSRRSFVFFLRRKDEVMLKFQQFRALVENRSGLKIKYLRTDGGGEYVGREFAEYLRGAGITHVRSAPHTPQQNGVAERLNRTLQDMARAMLLFAGLSKTFWAEAIATAVHLKNRCSHAALKQRTPEEMFSGTKPDLSHCRVFGCRAYVLNEDHVAKFDPRSKVCIFVGYGVDHGVQGYLVYDMETKKLKVSRNVVFDEKSFPAREPVAPPARPATTVVPLASAVEDAPEPVAVPPAVVNVPVAPPEEAAAPAQNSVRTRHGKILLNKRVSKPNPRYAMFVQAEPTTYKEAMESPDRDKWVDAMNEELQSIESNGVYVLAPLSPGRSPVGSKWVFKMKKDSTGAVVRYKARIVAQGCSQTYGEDYTETYAPVMKHASVRVLLSLAAKLGFDVQQMDVKTAFLHGDLHEEIFMVPPPGVVRPGEPKLYWKLRKSLYGLRQSPRMWNEKLDSFLREIGFVRCEFDFGVYVNVAGRVIIGVYVDDLALVGSTDAVARIKSKLAGRFDMSDLGSAHWLLGIEVVQDSAGIFLSQSAYIEKLLVDVGMDDCHPVPTPITERLTAVYGPWTKEEAEMMENLPYREIVGALNHLALCTRPDLSFAVSSVSRYNACPAPAHWIAVKRILRYLRGTSDYALTLPANGSAVLSGYADADWGGDGDTRKSTTGYIYHLGGAPILWCSKRQTAVALSSTEAEYMSMCQAVKECLWLTGLLKEIGGSQIGPVLLRGDNQSALSLAQHPVMHPRSKHIDIQFHFIREQVERGVVSVEYVQSEHNVADVFTKPLGPEKFRSFVPLLGLTRRSVASGSH